MEGFLSTHFVNEHIRILGASVGLACIKENELLKILFTMLCKTRMTTHQCESWSALIN